jgi:hypothetical protein
MQLFGIGRDGFPRDQTRGISLWQPIKRGKLPALILSRRMAKHFRAELGLRNSKTVGQGFLCI